MLKRQAAEQLLCERAERVNLCPLNSLIQVSPDIPGSAQGWDYDWRAMNGPDHYREAEGLLEEAESCEEPGPRALWCLELAKLHTALAQVAATALNTDFREWAEVAGRRLSSMSPHLVQLRAMVGCEICNHAADLEFQCALVRVV